MENFELTLPLDTVYYDRSFETASWYDQYSLKAGTYPVIFVDGPGTPRATVTVDATLLEEYRVNRLFSASSVQQTAHDTATTVTLSFYAYEIVPSAPVIGMGVGVLSIAECALCGDL